MGWAWPSMAASASIAADAPAQHGEAIDHGGVAVGADQRVGIGDRLLAFLARPHDLREVFEIDLVANAGTPAGTTRKLANASAPQRRNR